MKNILNIAVSSILVIFLLLAIVSLCCFMVALVVSVLSLFINIGLHYVFT